MHLAASIWQQLPIALRRGIQWLLQAKFTAGVCAVVLNDRNEILLLRHRFREENGWQLPGGFVGMGETLDSALQRELREETGFDVRVVSFLSANVGRPLHVDICFLARIMDGHLVPDTDEIREARFFSYEELSDVVDTEQMRDIDLALSRAE
jgi:ADP-ribose pyrophosphatase YjhB (NUDIX family)